MELAAPPSSSAVIAPGTNPAGNEAHTEESSLFADRPPNPHSITPEQAFAHMVKAMLGTGLLSLPFAFQHSGLYLGLILLVLICIVCLHCMRQVVYAAEFIRPRLLAKLDLQVRHHDPIMVQVDLRIGREAIDYANIMRGAVEAGPPWISPHGYFFKQLVNVKMFIAQLGFCCVYFVFMAENLNDFFVKNTEIYLPKGVWMLLLLAPVLAICSIRRLDVLAPFAQVANVIYLTAVAIVVYYFFQHLQPAATLTKFGHLQNLPLFFGTVMFAFEGVCVVMPLENRMEQPHFFIAWNGVLNSSCLVVLAIFAVTGFYGYLAFGDDVAETVTLNLPREPFYETLKLMFVFCVFVSYPLQFFVPMERVEKFIVRKCATEKHTRIIYLARLFFILMTLAIAELVPHLALFISLIGAFAGTSLALLFPPIIHLLVAYAQNKLTPLVYAQNVLIFGFAIIGFATGTYSALRDIIKTFQ